VQSVGAVQIRESQNPQPLELRFRALLAECDARVHFHRESPACLSELYV